MDFMTSLFGGEPDGKPKGRRRVRMSSTTQPAAGSPQTDLEVNGLRGRFYSERADQMVGDPTHLPPEDEEGNVEYKLKLVNPSASRLTHLVTQMKWRLREGNGEAIYEIGVEDSGYCTGLNATDLAHSINTLRIMAERLDASITVVREREVTPSTSTVSAERRRKVAEVLVRKVPESQQFIDLRIAVVGSADAGKSTLLGVLTQGEMDNGRGKARLNLFRHLHEVQTGRTSSISLEIIGFDSDGQLVNYADHNVEEICEKSTKLVTFIDLAGHHKYLRTTIFGLTGYKPHFAVLVVAANVGAVGTTKEHFALVTALQMPVFVVVTKIDIASKTQLNKTLTALEAMLRGPGSNKTPIQIQTEDDAISAAQNIDRNQTVPIFLVSSVTGRNLPLVQKFINLLPPSLSTRERQNQLQEISEFHIDEIFNVPDIGMVTAGLLVSGCVREGDRMLLGPDPHGGFSPVLVDSLQRSKAPCRVVQAGQAASVSIGFRTMDGKEISLRKGMVLIDPKAEPVASMAFEAEVYTLYHPSDFICIGFQTTVHIGNVRQTGTIVDIVGRPCLRRKETVKVKFMFLRNPEYITIGSRLLFREGKTKGIGQVTAVCLDPTEFPSTPRTRTF